VVVVVTTVDVRDEELERLKKKKLDEILRVTERRWTTKERIVVPTDDEGGLNARLSEHFGRAPCFVVVELEDGNVSSVQVISNESEHFGGFGRAAEAILRLRPSAVITYGMGPRALKAFQEAGVAVLRANADTVKGVIEAYRRGELEELTEGYLHARR
jgi:predicted Fe-Mo cluster-binding NifX family protein